MGNKFRPQIEQIAASVLQDVDAEFDRSELAERAAAQSANRDEIFAQAKSLSKEARYALVDELLETNTNEALGKSA